MPTDFDFDPRDSDLRVGIELEFPRMGHGDEFLADRGNDSSRLQSEVCDHGLPPHLEARPTYDGTVGLEIVSDVLDVADASNWYYEVLDYMRGEYNADLQPTGLMANGSTAGLHIHVSSLSESEARELARISETPWAKVLFCSSIATHNDETAWPVFRGGSYCRMGNGLHDGRYSVVNARSNGHFEWRMPEPMHPDHVQILQKFLAFFHEDPSIARDYAQELLDDADDRITAIKRAEKVGMDLAGLPTVQREPLSESQDFYETVADGWAMPEIYQVTLDDQRFYLFDSRLDGEFEANGVGFHTDDVLWADTLNVVTESSIIDDVRRAYNTRNQDESRTTEATDELKKIMKKKKGRD